MKDLAVGLGSLRSRLLPKTRIEIGLPIPDGYDGTRFELLGTNVDELAVDGKQGAW